jgi:beta-lactamase superfamily II metal-dependent hydrolase
MPIACLRRPILVLGTLVLAGATHCLPRSVAVLGAEPFRITFLDVGQGDAVLLRAPEGKVALIDAGPGADLVARLRSLDVDTIALLVASHAHLDHIGGMEQVIEGMPVRAFMDNGRAHDTQTYLRLMATLRRRTDIAYLAATPRTIALGSTQIAVLPLPDGGTDQNDGSVALLIRYGAFVALLTGDSEAAELTWLADRGVIPDVALLKAPHHGAANGFTHAFLAVAQPEIVVIPVGDNGYGHPHREALAAYAAVAREVYRTDLHGDVTISVHEHGRIEVTTSR